MEGISRLVKVNLSLQHTACPPIWPIRRSSPFNMSVYYHPLKCGVVQVVNGRNAEANCQGIVMNQMQKSPGIKVGIHV